MKISVAIEMEYTSIDGTRQKLPPMFYLCFRNHDGKIECNLQCDTKSIALLENQDHAKKFLELRKNGGLSIKMEYIDRSLYQVHYMLNDDYLLKHSKHKGWSCLRVEIESKELDSSWFNDLSHYFVTGGPPDTTGIAVKFAPKIEQIEKINPKVNKMHVIPLLLILNKAPNITVPKETIALMKELEQATRVGSNIRKTGLLSRVLTASPYVFLAARFIPPLPQNLDFAKQLHLQKIRRQQQSLYYPTPTEEDLGTLLQLIYNPNAKLHEKIEKSLCDRFYIDDINELRERIKRQINSIKKAAEGITEVPAPDRVHKRKKNQNDEDVYVIILPPQKEGEMPKRIVIPIKRKKYQGAEPVFNSKQKADTSPKNSKEKDGKSDKADKLKKEAIKKLQLAKKDPGKHGDLAEEAIAELINSLFDGLEAHLNVEVLRPDGTVSTDIDVLVIEEEKPITAIQVKAGKSGHSLNEKSNLLEQLEKSREYIQRDPVVGVSLSKELQKGSSQLADQLRDGEEKGIYYIIATKKPKETVEKIIETIKLIRGK